MKFRQVYNNENEFDVLLIQPQMLQKVLPKYIDPVQQEYWSALDCVGSLFGDLPTEPNWGLLYISSNLKRSGYTVGLLDFHLYDYVKFQKKNEFINYDDISRIIALNKFKIVGISSMTLSHTYALEIAKICKKVNPECKVVLGGIHFSYMAEKVLLENPCVDFILSGEGEFSFPALVKDLYTREKWTEIPGLSYREEQGLHINDQYQLIENLSDLPFPDYDLWPEDVPIIPRIYSARGCNGGCSYCVVNNFFCNQYRKRDVEDVLSELEYIVERFHCEDVLLGDLNFAADKKAAMDLCEKIVERGYHIRWWCQTRPDGLDDEIVSKMKAAGCVQIGIGFESIDEEILDGTNSAKGNKHYNTKELCCMVKKHDIEVQGYFIVGLPGETMDSAIRTIKFIDDLTSNGYVDVTHLAVLVPYPGTPIYNNPDEFGVQIISDNFQTFLMNCDFMNAGVPVVCTEALNNYQIYALWQLALSTAAKNFRNRVDSNRPELFSELDSFVQNISLS